MKINKILFAGLLLLSFSSCSKWLTIYPQDQIAEKELYEYADGFYNQINGIYKVMSEDAMYGREMTWGYVDALAQYYDFSVIDNVTYNAYSQGAVKYEHKNPKALSIINNFWEKGYNVIANCNDVIEHTIEADSMLFPKREAERKLILGEAYALRAYLHFDMLRLFAPAPIKGNVSEKYIPYVKTFGDKIVNKVTTREVLENAIADLELAEKLTADYDADPSYNSQKRIKNISERLELPNVADRSDRFLYHRGYRLNHYAIKALIARVSLYAGDYEKALKYSQELINLKWFSFTTATQFDSKNNKKLYDDVIFATYNNLQNNIYSAINIDDDDFLTVLRYSDIFEGDGGDLRSRQWEDVKRSDNTIFKKSVKTRVLTTSASDGKEKYCNVMSPLIRLSEMYYIAAECLFSTDKAAAFKLLETLKKSRAASTTIPNVGTQDEFNQIIFADARREFQMEGQLFFLYKRLNLKIYDQENKLKTLDQEFVLPIPSSNDIN